MKKMIDISKHITMKEAIRSEYAQEHGIFNEPNARIIGNMQYVAQTVFEPLRAHFNNPIRVNNFYRSTMLNKAIGGSATSQHVLGQAMDIDAVAPVTNRMLFAYILKHLPYDQLIWEFGSDANPDWIHVSLSRGINRRQVLRSRRASNGTTSYEIYRNALLQ